MSRGRPRLNDNDKRGACNFTVSPTARDKVSRIKKKKSPFISAVLASVPDAWISEYNKSPDKWIENFKPFGTK